MSLLPQRKKSPGEIAKLRETLGIGGPPPVDAQSPIEAVFNDLAEPERLPRVAESVRIPAVQPLAPLPVEDALPTKQVRSFKRSERIPVLPVDESGPLETAHPLPPRALEAASPLPVPQSPRIVRSLRKSEQIPLAALPPPAPDSKLPIHRHSDRELNELRRHDALAMLGPAGSPPSLTAHPVLIVPGYLFAIAGAVFFYFYDAEARDLWVTAGCAAAAVAFALVILLKKPMSRHHAAFIAVIALFVIVFGALHYFPQLRHGT